MAWRLSEEEAFENFQKQMTEGNAKPFWDNFALFMRNWKKIRKYPALFNVKVGEIGFSPTFVFKNANLGSLVHTWKCPTIRVNCPHCPKQAYYVPANYRTYDEDDEILRLDGLYEKKNLETKDPYFLFCPECNKLMKSSRLIKYHHKFQILLNTWVYRSFFEKTKSNLSLASAVDLLKQSEASGVDPEEFYEGAKKEDLIDNPRPFSMNTTLQEFRALLWEDYPYDEEYMSRDELVKLVSLYDVPEKQRISTDAEYALEKKPGESHEDFLARDEALMRSYKPEMLSTEELNRRIVKYECLNHWLEL